MPTPTRTFYAMEEFLEPWIHYIPIENLDMSDLEDKMRWVIDHDEDGGEEHIRARYTFHARFFVSQSFCSGE
jgi:hypothetical protein